MPTVTAKPEKATASTTTKAAAKHATELADPAETASTRTRPVEASTTPEAPEAREAPVSIWENTRFELWEPTKLVLESNSRIIGDIAKEDPDLCRSIAEHGVLVPLIANPGQDGRPAVRDGFSRALAALQAPKTNPKVPVLITESVDADEWTRIQEQFVVNHVRRGYTEANKAVVYEQMSMFGFGADEIAQRLGGGTTSEAVHAGLAVRANAKATKSLQDHPQLTLEQAAALVEFEDDEQATAALQTTLEREPEQIDHQVARLRQDRAHAQAREKLIAELTEQGVRIVKRSWSDAQQKELRDLRRSREDNTVLGDDPQVHAQCPGHAAFVVNFRGETPEAVFLCTEWKKQRHVDRYGSSGGAGPKSEAEKAEMRKVRQNNADWRAAEEVRRAFLRKLVARKTPPKRAQQFLAAAMLADQGAVEKSLRFHHIAVHQLFGGIAAIKDREAMLTKIGRASANDAVMMQLVAVLAAYEASTDKDTWRRATADQQRYFAALKVWGYTLSPVEQLVLHAKAIGSAYSEAVTGPVGSTRTATAAPAKRGKRTSARAASTPTTPTTVAAVAATNGAQSAVSVPTAA